MIEKICLCLTDESGAFIEIPESQLKLQSKLDTLIADMFSEIVRRSQSIGDDEIRTAEKFNLAQNLKNYLKEMKQNAGYETGN